MVSLLWLGIWCLALVQPYRESSQHRRPDGDLRGFQFPGYAMMAVRSVTTARSGLRIVMLTGCGELRRLEPANR